VRIERADTNDGITFTLIGRLEGGAARHLTRVVRGPVSDGSTVTLDLSALESCDADGLRALGTLLDRARAASGRLVLASPTEPIREILAAFELRDALHVTGDPPINVRYLFRVNCAEPFAYAPGRVDFYLASDDSLWAHESPGWLLAARSGAVLAHRTGAFYYNPENGEPLFSEMPTSTDQSEAHARRVN
jgi:anti-anti-sigma regulatory factor